MSVRFVEKYVKCFDEISDNVTHWSTFWYRTRYNNNEMLCTEKSHTLARSVWIRSQNLVKLVESNSVLCCTVFAERRAECGDLQRRQRRLPFPLPNTTKPFFAFSTVAVIIELLLRLLVGFLEYFLCLVHRFRVTFMSRGTYLHFSQDSCSALHYNLCK